MSSYDLCACGARKVAAALRCRVCWKYREGWEERDMGYETPCWIWLRHKDRWGYGKLRKESPDGHWLAHRRYYEWHVGPIPEGMTIDHLCRVKACVNPAHMEPVPSAENTRRASRLRTHCKHGHPYDETNTRYQGGRRWCRICERERSRTRRPAATRTSSPAPGAMTVNHRRPLTTPIRTGQPPSATRSRRGQR